MSFGSIQVQTYHQGKQLLPQVLNSCMLSNWVKLGSTTKCHQIAALCFTSFPANALLTDWFNADWFNAPSHHLSKNTQQHTASHHNSSVAAFEHAADDVNVEHPQTCESHHLQHCVPERSPVVGVLAGWWFAGRR